MVEKIRAAVLLHKDLRNRACADWMQVTVLHGAGALLLSVRLSCLSCALTLTARLIEFLDSAWRERFETCAGFGAGSSQTV